ncbi:MAG: hypothetical protein QM766_04755 [Burkholderiaceae bacterium]
MQMVLRIIRYGASAMNEVVAFVQRFVVMKIDLFRDFANPA